MSDTPSGANPPVPSLEPLDPLDPRPATRSNPLRSVLIAVAALIAAAAVYYFGFHTAPQAPNARVTVQFPFGAEEQAYAPRLELSGFALSRAENFLHQEVTYMDGDIKNGGDRSIRNLTLTVEFQDELNQVVLRETQPALTGASPLLPPGQSAHFQISFDHVPSSWNMQMPSARVTGIQFAEK